MGTLFKKLTTLVKDGFTGTVTLSFHQGSVSKMIKVQTTETMDPDGKTDNELANLRILKREK